MGDGRSEIGDGRWEIGDRRSEMGDRRWEIGDRRSEMGDGRSEIGDRRSEIGDRRWEIGDGRLSSELNDSIVALLLGQSDRNQLVRKQRLKLTQHQQRNLWQSWQVRDKFVRQ
jgi:hypothetical protein